MLGLGLQFYRWLGAGSTPPLSQIAYVSDSGNDGTAELGNVALPFSTYGAAESALLAAFPSDPLVIEFVDINGNDAYPSSLALANGVTLQGAGGPQTLTLIEGLNVTGLVINCYVPNVTWEPNTLLTTVDVGVITGTGTIDNLSIRGADATQPPDQADLDTSGASGVTGANAASDVDSGGVGGVGGNATDATGNNGSAGATGGAGYTIALQGTLTVGDWNGDGGAGAIGGSGQHAIANGGPGGPGGNGWWDGSQFTTQGGNGGNGGNGAPATGGNGGNGGDGGTGAIITYTSGVTVPSSTPQGGAGGAGNYGGLATASGGAGGAGGDPSGSPAFNGSSGAATNGTVGSAGATGAAGSVTAI